MELVCTDRTFVFRAPSEEAYVTWLSAIQNLLLYVAHAVQDKEEEGGLRDSEGFRMSTDGSYAAAVHMAAAREAVAAAAEEAVEVDTIRRPRPGAPGGASEAAAPAQSMVIAPKSGKPVPRLRPK